MGCGFSKVEKQEMVCRCKGRKRYMKELLKARQALSSSHAMYIWSLRATGSSLLHFSTNETTLHHHQHQHQHQHQHHLINRPPPPLSPTWTSTTASSALPPPPPPPPPPLTPPPSSSTWDFWAPFVPPPPSSSEEEWENETETETATATASDAAATNTTVDPGAATASAPSSSAVSGFSKEISTPSGSELAMVVSRNTKDLMEIVKEVDEYFLKAADAGGHLARLLENHGGKVCNNYVRNLNPSSLWSWGSRSPKPKGYRNIGMEMNKGNTYGENAVCSHSSTLERLYAWEKKLYQEVKNAESIRIEHEKKMGQVRKLEMKRAEYVKAEKAKKDVEKLESQMMVSSRAIETTAAEIINLRETELYPQLIELVKGLMCMWRNMYESHQVQTHIVQQLKYLNPIPSTEPTSEIHRQVTLQLELEIQQWHLSFCNLVKAQRDYIQSLTGWLRLSLFHYNKNSLGLSSHESGIYNFCEEWNMSINRIPDRVASEGIKSFLTAVHDIVVQQREEYKQKKRLETVFKDFEKKASELKATESKYGPFSMLESGNKNPVAEKRAKVETLKAKAEEEKRKHEKTASVTRTMTLNNLQIGFPHVFQSMVGFSSVCMQAFESVYNQTKSVIQDHDVRRLLA